MLYYHLSTRKKGSNPVNSIQKYGYFLDFHRWDLFSMYVLLLQFILQQRDNSRINTMPSMSIKLLFSPEAPVNMKCEHGSVFHSFQT